MAKLTAKQQKFVEEYLIDLNVTQAAIRAGYSKKSACRIGLDLFQKTHVLRYLQDRQAELSQKTKITQERVLGELAAIAFARLTDYQSVAEGEVSTVDTSGLSEAQTAALSGFKVGQFGIEVRLHDKGKALELLGKHLGMFRERAGEGEEGTGVIVLGEVDDG